MYTRPAAQTRRSKRSCCTRASLASAAAAVAVLGRARVWRIDAIADMWARYDAISLALLSAVAAAAVLQWAVARAHDDNDKTRR
jgi:hypothetical protein